ncbi:MAG: T9SS type A sorting domain-containing protein [Melioribacteraceae bacterium]
MKKLITLLFLVVSFAVTPILAQFTGSYYIGIAGTRPGGGDPDYLTLKSALDAVNAGTITGDCTFYITSDLTEVTNVCLGVNTDGHTITFKPAPTIVATITFTQVADNTGASGNFVFGVPNLTTTSATNYAMLTVNNIVIDGSNTVGGTTRDLTFQNVATANANTVVLRLLGEVNNFKLKNTVVKQISTLAAYAVALVNRFFTPTLFTPDSVLVENCEINASFNKGQAFAVTTSGTFPTYWNGVSNLTLKNNKLVATARGIFLNSIGGPTVISGNEISVNQIQTSTSAFGIYLFYVDSASVIDIYNNKINQLQSVNSAATFYSAGIECGNNTLLPYTANIYNNFIGGFSSTIASGTTIFYGIRATANAAPTVNLYHNSIYMDDLLTSGATITYYGVYMAQGAVTAKNNIVYDKEGDFSSSCIARTGTGGTLVSDYNNYYPAGALASVGYFGTAATPTLTDWRTASVLDANSTSKDVTFTSVSDLHLSGASLSDGDLMGVPVGITTDIDGNLRDALAPYKGADEGLRGIKGDYYVGIAGSGPGATNPQFASLKAATDYVNDAIILGNVNLYITSDITELYTDAVGIGLAINPDPYTLTIKPYTGVQPVITFNYPTDLNSGPSGAFIIGIPGKGNVAWASLKTTKNIVIDGSNTVGGTTRDLTLQTDTAAQRNAIPLVIVGDVSNVTVKNCNIFYKVKTVSTSGNNLVGAVLVRSTNQSSVDWVPKNLTFDNNHISSNFAGVAQSIAGLTYYAGSPFAATFPSNITIKNNLIEGNRRAIGLYKAGSTDIFNNEIITNQRIAAAVANEGIYASDVMAGSVINIYNNKISKLSTLSTGAAYGITAISIESNGTYNVYNNMITGFELTAVNPSAYLTGIKNSSATDTLNCYNNTIFMNDIADIGTGTVVYKGLSISNGLNTVKNNIVFSAEANFNSYCYSRDGALGTLTSNYNDLFVQDNVNGRVGNWNSVAALTLADWKTASGQDANSKSVTVNFVSLSNLHLTGASDGDVNLIGTPIVGLTKDIDGDTRSITFPYIGADESNTPLPVELTSFAVSSKGNIVELNWQTATEKNSSYFEIQRKSEKSDWATVGKVNASGTTTERVKYSFTEKDVKGPVVIYRLKMIDLDGSYSYSNEVEVKVDVPVNFELSQNYPNPFNPSTTIKYAIPVDSKVRIDIYSTLGELVTTLVNDLQTAGNYSVAFDASRFASGTYIYRLTANSTVITKKMLLIK